MEIKSIKKGAGSLLDVFMVILIGIFAFTGIFMFIVDNAEEANIAIDSRYNDTFNNVTAQHEKIENLTYRIRDNVEGISEAESGIESAFYGMKGVLALFKLPLEIIDTGRILLAIGLGALDIVPLWIRVTSSTGILIILVFAGLRFVTQRGNSP